MEFYVVDPKEITFADWSEKMRDFFAAESMSFTESTDLYYVERCRGRLGRSLCLVHRGWR